MSITTVGIYLRALRMIINIAIDNTAFRKEDYPFGKRRYVIPTGKNIKKALPIDQIKKIFDYPTSPGLPRASERFLDIYLFMQRHQYDGYCSA